MPRELMRIDQIKELMELIRGVFEYIENLKNQNPIAKKIKLPQIPSILSESLAIHLLERSLVLEDLEDFNFVFGGNVADIIATRGNREKKIEVKGTARSAFQYFSEKDITADFILWIHFADFFMSDEEVPIKIYIIRNPRAYFDNPKKITLSRVQSLLGHELHRTEASFQHNLQVYAFPRSNSTSTQTLSHACATVG